MLELIATYLGLLVFAPLLAVFERRRPAMTFERTRRGVRMDILYWVVTPLFTGTLARMLVYGVLAVIGWLAGYATDGPAFLARAAAITPFSRLPFTVQFPLALLVADFLGYWSHRLRHTWALWRLHAVHHAAHELTALTAARLHPLDEALDSVLLSVPVLLLGFSPAVFAALAPLFVVHTLLLHANVTWSFGPLGYVFSSPRFHRRHHARDLPNANFGGVLSIFDVIFGTFTMPAGDSAPFGVPEMDVPEGFLGQLWYPVKRLL